MMRQRSGGKGKTRVRAWRLVGCQAESMPTLSASEHLRTVVAAVESAGCEVMPSWANGALMIGNVTRLGGPDESSCVFFLLCPSPADVCDLKARQWSMSLAFLARKPVHMHQDRGVIVIVFAEMASDCHGCI